MKPRIDVIHLIAAPVVFVIVGAFLLVVASVECAPKLWNEVVRGQAR